MIEGQPKKADQTFTAKEMPWITGNPSDRFTRTGFPEEPKVPTHPADVTVINGDRLREELLYELSPQADPDESLTLGGSPEPTDSEIG